MHHVNPIEVYPIEAYPIGKGTVEVSGCSPFYHQSLPLACSALLVQVGEHIFLHNAFPLVCMFCITYFRLKSPGITGLSACSLFLLSAFSLFCSTLLTFESTFLHHSLACSLFCITTYLLENFFSGGGNSASLCTCCYKALNASLSLSTQTERKLMQHSLSQVKESTLIPCS